MRTCALILVCIAGWLPAAAETPAEAAIRKAEAAIAAHPDHAAYHNALAMAYARRARESSDVRYYAMAEKALERSLQVAPGNFEALKTRTWILLGNHEFGKALESARALNKRSPDDVTVYGYLVDANVELGNYKEAVSAAQWMLNLRPGNVAGLTRAAYLRELYGDVSGAIDLMQMAYDSTPFPDTEDRAWLLVQLSHLSLVEGDQGAAERFAKGALEVFPSYHYALGALGNLRMAQHRYDEAARLFRQRFDAAPHAENLFALAEALHAAGRTAEANPMFAKFEELALKESGMADNANHELIAYYAEYAHEPSKALRIAAAELKRRQDVFTRCAYAEALAVDGQRAEAAEQMKVVVAQGVKDPRIHRIAEMLQQTP